MTQNYLKLKAGISLPKKRRAVAEVISSLLLVAITVVGAVILTAFLDESFLGSGVAASSSDVTTKSIKLIAFDTRDGGGLMGYSNLNNTSPTDQKLCRVSCVSNEDPGDNGTEFMVVQIENQSVNPVFLHNVYLDNVNHVWDITTSNVILNPQGSFSLGEFPGDGKFSILTPDDPTNTQRPDNQLKNGETVNLLIKLDTINDDIPLSKTILAQFNIGANSLSEFLIESGGAQ